MGNLQGANVWSAVLELRLNNDPNMVVEVEVGEHLGSSNHNIVCAKTVEG